MNAFLEEGPKNPVKIQDNTFRDGHQSLLATRMRTEDMIPIAEKMDGVGFWAILLAQCGERIADRRRL